MKIGVLGGTFDPPHLGHLIVAQEAAIRLGLVRVLFVPAGQPWLKSGRLITPAVERLEMIRLAIASNPHFALSTVDIERPGPSYSVDTVAALQAELGPKARLYFLVGLDALAELLLWKNPMRLVKMCRLVGMTRPGFVTLDIKSLASAIPGASRRIMLLEVPQIGISSSEIRQRVASGLSIRYLVPEAVERYIIEHKLYT